VIITSSHDSHHINFN